MTGITSSAEKSRGSEISQMRFVRTKRKNQMSGSDSTLTIRQTEDGVRHSALEAVVVQELLEQFGVVLHDSGHDPDEGLVVLDAGVLLVGVLPGVLAGGVGGFWVKSGLPCLSAISRLTVYG